MTVFKNIHGPIWPLGGIIVPTPGTPVNIMNLVDPTATTKNAPEVPTGSYTNNATQVGQFEYSPECWSIVFTPIKATGTANTGVIYVCYYGGSKADLGSIITILRATDPPFILYNNSQNRNGFSPYKFLIDANTANDECQVCLFIG